MNDISRGDYRTGVPTPHKDEYPDLLIVEVGGVRFQRGSLTRIWYRMSLDHSLDREEVSLGSEIR